MRRALQIIKLLAMQFTRPPVTSGLLDPNALCSIHLCEYCDLISVFTAQTTHFIRSLVFITLRTVLYLLTRLAL